MKVRAADILRDQIRLLVLGSSHGARGFRASDGEFNLACDFQDLYYSYHLYLRYADTPSLKTVALTYSVFSPGHDTLMTGARQCCVAFKMTAGIPYRDETIAAKYRLQDFEGAARRKVKRLLRRDLAVEGNRGNETSYWSCYASMPDEVRASGHLKNNDRGNDMTHYVRLMLSETRRRGQQLVVVIPPVRAGYRAALPDAAILFKDLYAIEGIKILDLFGTDKFQGSDFLDPDHLALRGAEKFTVDSIVSLGGFCAAAHQLRIRGLRHCSMPFDWLFMPDETTVKWLPGAFADDFREFLHKENLVDLPRDGIGGLAPYQYRDARSGYGFIHHFYKPSDQGGYEQVATTMARRLKRFLSIFKPGAEILLILATPFPFDLTIADKIMDSIRTKYPETQVDLHVIQFGVKFDDPEILGKYFDRGCGVFGELYARHGNTYDLHRTSYAWSFLDVVSLKGREVGKPKGLAKIRFKLWKNLSTWLMSHGYGCSGLRFHNGNATTRP